MTRPEIIRAVAAETAEENLRSPRVSWANGDIGDLQQYAEDLAAGVADSLNGQAQNQNGRNNKMAADRQQQQDALAIAQNGGLSGNDAASDDGDLDADDADDGMDDDMMDKISSSPSIEDEDIDFEFVYALHTFVATVEGQANATKGDTMVLLDDSNSYWWLVRVVKDSSIGYLPAEHIETPTERLARLNKHRNIDLSATMLGDQAEKSKNPIKSAMRRRKAKTVTFAAPTYVDYSDIDYDTSEDEDAEAEYFAQQQQSQQQAASQQANGDQDPEDESAKVEPLKPRSQQKEVKIVEPAKAERGDEPAAALKANGRSSEEIFETNGVDGPKKTKDGTVRDSFFKDETVETKKITLTPNLLRDDGAPRASSESKEIKQRPSFDKLEKDALLSKDDKKKKEKDKKEKEKKSGFRSLFSRKDKKTKGDDDDDSFGKRSIDVASEGLEKESEEIQFAEDQPSPEKAASGPQRQPSKLQKQQPRTEPSPTRKGSVGAKEAGNGMDLAAFLSESKVNNVANVPPASMRIVEADVQDTQDIRPKSRDRSPEVARSNSQKDERSGISKIIPSRMQNGDPRPQKVTKAKARVALDDSDSLEDIAPEPTRQAPTPTPASTPAPAPAPEEKSKQLRPTLPGAYPDSYLSTQTTDSVQTEKAVSAPQPERLSESPVQVSPVTSNIPPSLMVDTSSQEENHSSPSSTPSPELIEREDVGGSHRNQDSIATSTSATTVSTWNDTSLRAFFDSSADIRDLLVVVYDKTDVAPAGPDHPVAGTLFKEQNAKLAEITSQLDNMLGDWLARKQRLRGTV
ncbi:putative sh3 domain-containing protein [Phaeoacremonium minimum UCRPA7]|uniref:Putative sh3 domain-containing protein n=1 Tax=Phaeoacremonium minimum (strain UCR-PA7) TaxID=1286976 RepID=R8BYM1_PHAM7|nr:putative sh3 domain-containing protein [Phaeoacremonium minimum UCRPA7]EOO04447.1 putative sh3 domain-containing protein [Phaeoacremonium minimum UCRPA7]